VNKTGCYWVSRLKQLDAWTPCLVLLS